MLCFDDVIFVSYFKCGIMWLKVLVFVMVVCMVYLFGGVSYLFWWFNLYDCVLFIDEIFVSGEEVKFEVFLLLSLMNMYLFYVLFLVFVIVIVIGCSVVYVCSDFKDMVVLFWYFFWCVKLDFLFVDMFEFVCDGNVVVGLVWDYVFFYWCVSVVVLDSVFFFSYEDMLWDFGGNVWWFVEFMGCLFLVVEEVVGDVVVVVEFCSFDEMKGLEVNSFGSGIVGSYCFMLCDVFFWKGVVGDWVNYMMLEMVVWLDGIFCEKF